MPPGGRAARGGFLAHDKRKRAAKLARIEDRGGDARVAATGDRRNDVLPIAAVGCVALLVRGVYLAEMSGSPLFDVLLGDGRRYDAWAREIAAGNWLGSQVFYQAPFYPYFLAVLYKLFGHGLGVVRVVQALLGSAACVLVALTGRRLLSARAGLVAGALLAVYPPAVFFDGLVQKASLDLFFMVLLLWLLAEYAGRPRPAPALAAGLVLGSFALTRENALALLPLDLAWLSVKAQPGRRRVVAGGLLLAGAAAVLVPVGLRNRAVGGEFLLTTSQLGPNFYIGNNPQADGRYRPLRPGRGSPEYESQDARELAEAAAGRPLTPAEVSRHWLERALAFVREQPVAWSRLALRKLLLVWSRHDVMDTDSLEAAADRSRLLATLRPLLNFGLLAPLCVIGVLVTRRQLGRSWLLHGTLVVWTLATAAFFVLARYRHAMLPAVLLFAAAGLGALFDAGRARSASGLAPGLAVALLAALACNWPLVPGDPRATTYASLGVALAEDDGQLDQAATQLERALALSPGFADAELALANVRLKQGRLDEAATLFRRVTEREPAHAQALNSLGSILARQGRTEEARGALERALQVEADSPEALYNLGLLDAQAGNVEPALGRFRRVAELRPGDPGARIQIANALAALGRAPDARAAYEQALALDPRQPEAHYKLSLVLDRLGETRAAREHFTEALRQAPEFGRLHLRLGARAELEGRWARAADVYGAVLAQLPEDPLALRLLAGLRAACPEAKLRDGPAAVALAERAVAAGEARDPGALAALAAAYAETGRFAQAVTTAERALELMPEDGAAPAYRAQLDLYRRRRPFRGSLLAAPVQR